MPQTRVKRCAEWSKGLAYLSLRPARREFVSEKQHNLNAMGGASGSSAGFQCTNNVFNIKGKGDLHYIQFRREGQRGLSVESIRRRRRLKIEASTRFGRTKRISGNVCKETARKLYSSRSCNRGDCRCTDQKTDRSLFLKTVSENARSNTPGAPENPMHRQALPKL